ncbi:MAG: efflux RND transporter periplasmic adaptor subunit [candidate division WOR-3 bacterium]|nr:MAG: efflux RND transporter periplasmic adaptor subunit [candidate division WOR-3 bacterium]
MKKKRLLIIIGAIVVVAIVIVLNLNQGGSGEEVSVSLVSRGNITSFVSASGELKAKAQIDISAETIARVKRINFREGDHVKKGDLLIELDDVQADATRSLALANLEQAEQDLQRAQKLIEQNLISRESFERVELNYKTAKASYAQALDTYRKTRIYSPISGKVMKINVEEGETAVMGALNYGGTVMMTVADMSQMIAVVKIDETDVPDVRVGEHAEVIADALPDSVYHGSVVKVGLMPIQSQLSTDEVTDFEVEIDLHEFSSLLRPGMNVKADIITSEKSDVLKIPIQASGKRDIDDESVETVFLIQNGKAALKEIVPGVSSDEETEIISGIEEGDTVITGPYRVLSRLKDGQKVNFKSVESDTMSSSRAPEPRRLLRTIRGRS